MLTIYGASDDLIEVEGDINEEFEAYFIHDMKAPVYLICSDGAAWRVSYDERGCWRFTTFAKTPSGWPPSGWTKTEATDPDDDYSDRLTCDHEIQWVALTSRLTARKPKREETDGQNPEETRA